MFINSIEQQLLGWFCGRSHSRLSTIPQPAQQECTLGIQMLTFVKKIHRPCLTGPRVRASVALLLNPRESSMLLRVRSLSCCRNEDIKGASSLHQVFWDDFVSSNTRPH